jgi:Ca2+-binding RTX toxin-like protein
MTDFTGGDGRDKIVGTDGGDLIDGAGGDDVLRGLGGADTIEGGKGDDLIHGGDGADRITDAGDDNAVFGDGGDDYINLESSGSNTVHGGGGKDVIYGGQGADVIDGGDGDDHIYGWGGNDTIEGGAGDDYLMPDSDRLITNTPDVVSYAHATAGVKIDLSISDWQDTGGAGVDKIIGFHNLWGSGFDDTLSGSEIDPVDNEIHAGAGADTVSGGLGEDRLFGEDGADSLLGGGGKDRLEGGAGQDTLDGGTGHDVFAFSDIGDSRVGAADLIQYLHNADLIDLGGIDADSTTAGDQAFHLVSALSGHAGEAALVYDHDAQLTRLELDVDGDGQADGEIDLQGDYRSFDHFVL